MCTGSWWPEEGSKDPVLAFFTYSFEKTGSLAECIRKVSVVLLPLPRTAFQVGVGIRAQALVCGQKARLPSEPTLKPPEHPFQNDFPFSSSIED